MEKKLLLVVISLIFLTYSCGDDLPTITCPIDEPNPSANSLKNCCYDLCITLNSLGVPFPERGIYIEDTDIEKKNQLDICIKMNDYDERAKCVCKVLFSDYDPKEDASFLQTCKSELKNLHESI